MSAWIWVVYFIPLLSIWGWQAARRRRVIAVSRDAHRQAQRVGLNEVVIVAAGGIAPTDFLKGVGVQVQTKYGTA
jgi:hypothetical protein